jgi:murein DD-endopeptidase MepM/ murein hydrolase activator NlpD
VLRLSGENLADTRAVVFLGGRGPGDDSRARPQQASPHRVLVQVPASARSGPVRVVAASAAAVGPRVRVLAPAPRPAPAPLPVLGGGAFPVQGAHYYGTEVNGFGGGRGHQGQDVLAACGTPLVAALPGEVTLTRFQERAGNYVVVKADDGTSQAYMHLLKPATVTKGQRLAAGQPLGQVGRTGTASACHLHFELWTAPGWYEGGKPVDPLPLLRSLDVAG